MLDLTFGGHTHVRLSTLDLPSEAAPLKSVVGEEPVSLPSFAQPPVSEVVAAVSFKAIAGLTTVQLSEFWRQRLAESLPKTEEQPPYVPPIERFDVGDIGNEIAFTFAQSMPSPRMWFVSSDDQELVQVQRDWFACNWRKVSPQDSYGRWPQRRAAFERWFGEFEDFVRAASLGEIEPTQCEVTYVNEIAAGEIWKQHGELHKVTALAGPGTGSFLPTPEQLQFAARYVISNDQGEPVGRLHVNVQPAIRRTDRLPIFVLTMTARGVPEGPGRDGILRFLDRGRQWIVRGFRDITTAEMHREWGLEPT